MANTDGFPYGIDPTPVPVGEPLRVSLDDTVYDAFSSKHNNSYFKDKELGKDMEGISEALFTLTRRIDELEKKLAALQPLRGEKGDQGPQGPQGIPGRDGRDAGYNPLDNYQWPWSTPQYPKVFMQEGNVQVGDSPAYLNPAVSTTGNLQQQGGGYEF